jgi:hypothetical protein
MSEDVHVAGKLYVKSSRPANGERSGGETSSVRSVLFLPSDVKENEFASAGSIPLKTRVPIGVVLLPNWALSITRAPVALSRCRLE